MADIRSGVETRIRVATDRDLPQLVAIYNYFVTTSHVTFDTSAFTVEQRRPWLQSFAATGRYRLLIAEVAGVAAGYASSQRLRPKPAYDCSVETTVYVAPEYARRGIGAMLYDALLASLEGVGVHQAFAGIALPNDASVALHEAVGFRHVGTFPEAGFKFDRYWDIAWYVRRLANDRDRGCP